MSRRTLEQLREEIDRVDDAILDLLEKRAEIALAIGDVKRAEGAKPVFLRPGREAMVLRRLLSRPGAKFPGPVIVRIWREIIPATLRLEAPFLVSAFEPEPRIEGESYLALARSYFGVETTLKPARTEAGVLRNVRDGKASIGVLPVPVDETLSASSKEPWWVTLTASGDPRPHIVLRLPWLRTPLDGPHGITALVIATVPPEPTGDDLTMVALEILDQTSRDRVRAALVKAGLELEGAAGWPSAADRTLRWQLVELTGFLEESDPKLKAFRAALGDSLRRLVRLGAYPRPPTGTGLSPNAP